MSENDASRIIDNSRALFQIVVSLTDDKGGIIYNHNMFTLVAGSGRKKTPTVIPLPINLNSFNQNKQMCP